MVEDVADKYPRAWAIWLLIIAMTVLTSIRAGRWYAQSVPVDADTLVIIGWALGAGAMMLMYRSSRWLDAREQVVARIERRLGGDA